VLSVAARAPDSCASGGIDVAQREALAASEQITLSTAAMLQAGIGPANEEDGRFSGAKPAAGLPPGRGEHEGGGDVVLATIPGDLAATW
jgi:hypothetical protein